MSSIELNLDFQDYAPAGELREGRDQDLASQRSIKTSDERNAKRCIEHPQQSILNLFPGSSSSTLADEVMRHAITVANRKKQPSTGNWLLNYLAQYFDVTTRDVVQRVIWSNVPIRRKDVLMDRLLNESGLIAPLANNSGEDLMGSVKEQRSYSYVERFIQSRPDLYGPLWVTSTLILMIGLFSNINNYLNMNSLETDSAKPLTSNISDHLTNVEAAQDSSVSWHYSMSVFYSTSSIIFLYLIMVPCTIWSIFWMRQCTKYYTLSEIVCAYGYALSIFIPLPALFIFMSPALRFACYTFASQVSSIVLILSFLPIVNSDPNPSGSCAVLIIIPICHFMVAYLMQSIVMYQEKW